VLGGCEALLERVAAMGLMKAIESAYFADVSRTPDGGRGVEGVFTRAGDYYNPFEEALKGVILSGVR
jgi:beta-lysine 5,6-aminomutase alpha subunit